MFINDKKLSQAAAKKAIGLVKLHLKDNWYKQGDIPLNYQEKLLVETTAKALLPRETKWDNETIERSARFAGSYYALRLSLALLERIRKTDRLGTHAEEIRLLLDNAQQENDQMTETAASFGNSLLPPQQFIDQMSKEEYPDNKTISYYTRLVNRQFSKDLALLLMVVCLEKQGNNIQEIGKLRLEEIRSRYQESVRQQTNN